jgi:outer membrane protein insertion porin family
MGSGNNVSIQVNSARSYKTYVFSYTNPYFTPDGVSQGFDVYHRTVNTTNTALAYYNSTSDGGAVRFGFPIGEKETIGVGIGLDATSISTNSSTPTVWTNQIAKLGGTTNLTIPLTLSWMSDGRDSFFFPTKGLYQKASLEVALPGGDLTYYRASYQIQNYFPLSSRFTLMLNAQADIANGYSGSVLPFYKNFYAGGVTSVRGYKASGIGPYEVVSGTTYHLGGNRRLLGNAEILWGVPGMDKSFRMGWFFDAGQVYGAGDKISLSDLRYSTGLSAAWISPIGPLRFSLGRALNKGEKDVSEFFQFQMGTTF